MDFRYFKTIAIISMCLLAAAACKKEEETADVKPSLSGSLTFELDYYLAPGSRIEVVPTGLKHPEGKGIGYYWNISPAMTKADTTRHENDPEDITGAFTYELPDSIGKFRISCTGFAAGYYNSQSYRDVITVDKQKSLTGRDFSGCRTITDSRDSKTYRINRIGSRDWFCENLCWNGKEGGEKVGIPYYNAEICGDVLGIFYSWDEARTACPEGWRLPDNEDWLDLGKALSGKTDLKILENFPDVTERMMIQVLFNDEKMWDPRKWSKEEGVTNSSRFNALPLGFANIFDNSSSWSGSNRYAAYWTGTENKDNNEQAYYRYMTNNGKDLMVEAAAKNSFATPVRCVRNAE